jgi:hypothetical protein
VIVDDRSTNSDNSLAAPPQEEPVPAWVNVVALLVWLVAGVVTFIPFARDTSPLNAVTLQVPGNQGNWWHVLVGAPFFLAYPMIWLRLRSLFSDRLSTPIGRLVIWGAVGLSTVGTIAVEAPFLLHLAGTSEWQRLSVLGLGFGIVIASAFLLFRRRRYIPPTRACLIGIETAYLANLALCLVVYSEAVGETSPCLGWRVSILIVWPIAAEFVWLFVQSFQTRARQIEPALLN